MSLNLTVKINLRAVASNLSKIFWHLMPPNFFDWGAKVSACIISAKFFLNFSRFFYPDWPENI
jgi:hypothetical protein